MQTASQRSITADQDATESHYSSDLDDVTMDELADLAMAFSQTPGSGVRRGPKRKAEENFIKQRIGSKFLPELTSAGRNSEHKTR